MSATFYVLSTRAALGQQVIQFLDTVFPAQRRRAQQAAALAARLEEWIADSNECYLVFREDLRLDGNGLPIALRNDYGAEEGDLIVEVEFSANGSSTSRTWRIDKEDTEDAALLAR